MAENNQKHAEVIRQKRGVPVYTTNPSILAKDDISRTRRTRIGTEQRGLVAGALTRMNSRKWTRNVS
jgi:hypothetical protein